MLKRRQVFAAVSVGPGTGEYARSAVRARRGSIEAALEAHTIDEERYPHQREYFSRHVVEAEELTMDRWPKCALVWHGPVGEHDSAFNATLFHENIGVAWAHRDSMHELMLVLTYGAMNSSNILRTNDDRSPDIAQVVPFVVSLQHELGLGVSVKAGILAMDWARTGDSLHKRWKSLSNWWWQWCKDPKLVATQVRGLELRVTEGFVVAYTDKGYPKSVWPDEASAATDAEPNNYGDTFVVRPTPVLTSDLFPQTAAVCYRYETGKFQAALFRLPLPETGVDPRDEWLRPFQSPMWGSGATREQAWLRILRHVFQESLVLFPRFSPRLINLPLAALADEGYRVPYWVRWRLAAWVGAVERAQKQYLAAIAAVREEMPR